jgi:peptidyl-dipeptidase Dcp
VLAACSQESLETMSQTAQATRLDAQTDTAANPFFQDWDTPFGIPPFAAVQDAHYKPAVAAAIAELQREVAAIRSNPDAPSFVNTIEALELSGGSVSRVLDVFSNITNTDTNETLQALEVEFYPMLSREFDAIVLDNGIWQRVKAVYEQRATLGLDEQQARLLELTHRDFVRAGAALGEDAKARMKEINARESELTTRFGQNLLAETKSFELWLTDGADLAGLPAGLVGSANKAAQAKGRPDAWLFGLNRSVYEPFMTYADKRDLRRQMFEAYRSRAAQGGTHDNRDLITEIAKLRAQAAALRGYRNHAGYQLETRMARTPENAGNFLTQVWKPSLARAREEKAEMQAIVEADAPDFSIEGHDWWYYAEKLRQQKYAIDDAQVKPYFQLENVRDGAFHVAKQLFGVSFEPLERVQLYHPEVQAYVVRGEHGQHLGVFMTDYFARDSKRGGAWNSTYRDASSVGGKVVRPIVTNNLNLNSPAAGEPALMSFDEVTTLFHEFGHALHGLMTTQRYERFSGTAGPRDYTEFPAQFMEHYAAEPEVLAVYARHYQTGEVIPAGLVEKIRKARTHNQGFKTTEYITAALLDLKWHLLSPSEAAAVEDAREFEVDALATYGGIGEIEPRYRSPYFSHVFAGGYAAGYYAYLWSEILDSDGFAAFKETGDIYNPELAQRLKENVYQAGGREEADVLYRKFRGQDPVIRPLLKNRGLYRAGD